MSYNLRLKRKDGSVRTDFVVFPDPTPRPGTMIDIEVDGKVIKAEVMSIETTRSRIPRIAVVDLVWIREL